MSLSHDGEIHLSPNTKFKELIVFVHHFGGSKLAMRRHIELVNQLGFDALSFNLTSSEVTFKKIPFIGSEKFGNRKVWAEDIASVLEEQKRPLVFYSFSFPSCSVAKFLNENPNSHAKGWICDGGPFVNMKDNYWNYFTHVTPIKNKLFRLLASELGAFFLGLDGYEETITKDIGTLPEGFPILSLRSTKDSLVPPLTIDKTFSKQTSKKIKIVEIPEGDHLEGLKKCPELYSKSVEEFLLRISSKQSNF